MCYAKCRLVLLFCDDSWRIELAREMHSAGLFIEQDGSNRQVSWEVGLMMQSGRAYYFEIPGAANSRIFDPSWVTSFSICYSTPSSKSVLLTQTNNILHAWYNSLQNLLSSSLLSKNIKIKVYRNVIILSVVLYGCETWSLTLREERSLRVSENRVLRRIFGPKRDEVTGEWRKLIMMSLMIGSLYPILFGW